MVPRPLRSASTLGTLVVAALIAALALAPAAGASNRRVSISNYQWSIGDVHVDLGEHVTWHWVGPDTMHSVTGDSANTAGIDSDPGDDLPEHDVGDSFQVSFDQPGTYNFVCKLHSTVRGTVTVSSTPGDPVTEPDDVPAARVDTTPPRINNLQLSQKIMHGNGAKLDFSLDERAKLDADYFRIGAGGKRKFAGWAKWKGYVGLNRVAFGGRSKHFRAKHGRYVAELRATDRQQNISKPREIRFQITPR